MTINKALDKLNALLSDVKRLKSSLYPSDWDHGPLHLIESRIVEIIEDLQSQG